MSSDAPWWNPEKHADRRPFLTHRARIKRAIRSWFETQGFTEVETGILQVSPGNEAHLHAFKTELVNLDLSRVPLYLHTSPEFACKKLLAAGERKIFSFAPVFRNRERGSLHAPEFVMLEWYRANESYETVMADAAAILKLATETADNRFVSWRGVTANPRVIPERLTVAQAFARYVGVDLFASMSETGNDASRLAAMATDAGITAREDDTWGDLFSKLLAALVEPKLGNGRSTLLTEYPASLSALARPLASDPRVAERFELYCCGVELANGFGELTDAKLQRQRLEAEMANREARYGEQYPLDEDFLRALALMPPSSGCALGFDRLVMLATGATRVDQVIWTTFSA
jgi:elongation factor P--(R)-beta-lysine ligase